MPIILRKSSAFFLKLFLCLLLFPLVFKAQNTIPTTTVTGCLKVDSTMHASGITVDGSARVDSSLIVNDSVRAQDIFISGSARIKGDFQLGGDLLFGNNMGISYKAPSVSSPAVFSLGELGNPPSLNPCVFATADPWFNMGGRIQLYDGPNNLALSLGSDGVQSAIEHSGNNGLLINYYCGKNIYLGTGSGSGGSAGTAGAKVYTGDEFYARKHVQIGAQFQPVDPNVTLNILGVTNQGIKLWAATPGDPNVKIIGDGYDRFTIWNNGNSHWGNNVQIGFAGNTPIQDANASLNINSAGLDGIKLNTWNNTAKLFSINNVNFTSYSPFVIYGDGNAQMGQAVQIGQTQSGIKTLAVNLNISSVNTQSAIVVNNGTTDVFRILKNGTTYIGDKAPLASGPHGDAKLAVDGKILAKSFYVNIHNSTWPDYVFESNYKLLHYSELEQYIIINKHLPNVPSAKAIEENGLNLSEMQKIQMEKIEELYLYIIRLEKEIEALKKNK